MTGRPGTQTSGLRRVGSQPRRAARVVPWIAAASGVLAGIVAERLLVCRRPGPLPGRDSVALGSIAGTQSRIEGPDGTHIAVETYGPAGAPQLVLAHGWMCSGRVWHELVVRLGQRWRIVTYDQPGHGRSTAPASGRYDLNLLGDTLTAVIDRATAPGSVVVMGHSLGGMGLLNALRRGSPAIRDRLGGAVLLSTIASARSERSWRNAEIWAVSRFPSLLKAVVKVLRRPRIVHAANWFTARPTDAAYLLTRWFVVGRDPNPEVIDFTLRQFQSSDVDMVLGFLEAIVGIEEDAGLAALDAVPVSLVSGTHDRVTPHVFTRHMAAHVGSRSSGAVDLQVLPGVGHMALLEAPDEVAAVAERHLLALGDRTGSASGNGQ